jgi:leader peptidase (prepilin peptidase)/N-methyltransferase
MAESVLFATVFFVGLTVGSFLNVVIHRGPVLWGLVDGPTRGDLVAPRSYCPSCKTPLRIANLIPVLSYFAQRGRCARCDARISARYPIVETFGAASAVLAVLMFGWTPAALAAAIFAFALIPLAVIDLETGYLPDAITLPLIGAGLAANAAELFTPLRDAVIGAAAGFTAFWAIGVIYERLRKRDGLGLGDAKLLAAIGAWTGWAHLPIVILIAALGTLGVIAVRQGMKADDAIPFGPGLCAAGFLALYFGDRFFNVL